MFYYCDEIMCDQSNSNVFEWDQHPLSRSRHGTRYVTDYLMY